MGPELFVLVYTCTKCTVYTELFVLVYTCTQCTVYTELFVLVYTCTKCTVYTELFVLVYNCKKCTVYSVQCTLYTYYSWNCILDTVNSSLRALNLQVYVSFAGQRFKGYCCESDMPLDKWKDHLKLRLQSL